MFETFGSALEAEIAYRRERLYAAGPAGGRRWAGGRRSRRTRTASTKPQPGTGRS